MRLLKRQIWLSCLRVFANSPMKFEFPLPKFSILSRFCYWRLFIELFSLFGFVVPFGNVLGPLVLWLLLRDLVPEVDREGKKIINFNLSWAILSFLPFVGRAFDVVWIGITLFAIVKAGMRRPFQHPLAIPLLR